MAACPEALRDRVPESGVLRWRLALALASCGKSDADGSLPTNGQGMLQLSFDIPGYGGQSKAAEYDALAISTLRLYKVEPDGQGGATESLIRKYKPATDVPANLYLAAGKYKVTVEALTFLSPNP